MAIVIGHWERRDSADRADLGSAAFAYCQTLKRREGIRSARFFWVSPDRIVTQTEADSQQILDEAPDGETAKALFALADVARAVDTERWMDPRDGQAAYKTAGR